MAPQLAYRTRFARLAPGRRARMAIAAILLAAVVGGCKADLYTKLQEREANEMVALLLNNGFEAGRVVAKDGTSTVKVEQKQFAQAVELLKANGYPRQTFTNMGEVFKGGGLIASPTEERARYVYALSEELSKTISDIDGVLSARIHVVLPKNDLLRQDATPSSASVFIRHDARAPLKALLPQIKMLVANSIEGLSYEKVSVVFVPVERNEPQQTRPVTAAYGGAAARAASDLPEAAQWAAAALGGLLLGAGGVYWLGRRRREPPPSRPDFERIAPIGATGGALPSLSQPRSPRGTPRQAA